MNSYSQNKEDLEIEKIFGSYIGTCLSIGENSGDVLSNVLGFIENSWAGVLVEPSAGAFEKLKERHAERLTVQCINVAVADFIGNADLFDSGTHLNKGDTALLSTLSKADYEKWKATTQFNTIQVEVIDFKELLSRCMYVKFDYISIDAEGFDLVILRQMNLRELGCRVLCIEHNGNKEALEEITQICASYGLTKQVLLNAENVVFSYE